MNKRLFISLNSIFLGLQVLKRWMTVWWWRLYGEGVVKGLTEDIMGTSGWLIDNVS